MNSQKIQKITNYIFLKSQPKKADLAFVFGNRHEETINKIYELYQKNKFSKIIISGGKNRVTQKNEAQTISQKLIRLGIKSENILLENKSRNSLENVTFSKEIINQKIGFKNINTMIVITKHYHSRRALMTLKKYFPKHIKIYPVTYSLYNFTKDNWFKSRLGKNKVLSEWKKIKKYLKQGDITEL